MFFSMFCSKLRKLNMFVVFLSERFVIIRDMGKWLFDIRGRKRKIFGVVWEVTC